MRRMSVFGTLCLLLGLLVVPFGSVWSASLDWDKLLPNEQVALQGFKNHWKRLNHSQRMVLRRWAATPATKRNSMKQRYQQWQRMSKQQRTKVIQQLQRFNTMSVEQRKRIKIWRDWVKRLPRPEQQRLHYNWPNMNKQQRQVYIQRLQKQYGR